MLATLARPWAAEVELWAAAALITEAGLVWATWISTGHHLDLATTTAWFGIAVGSAAAPIWLRSAGRRSAPTAET